MATTMQDYLKRYNATTTTRGDDEIKAKPKKIKKLKGASRKQLGKGVVIVDDDGVWQKEGQPEEEYEDDGDKPTVIEEVDVKVMQKMEALKAHRPYLSVANDGSGWTTVKGDVEDSKERGDGSFGNSESSKRSENGDLSPPRKRQDSPDLSPPRRGKDAGLSPPRKKVTSKNEVRHDSPNLSPPRRGKDADSLWGTKRSENGDLSPPRKRHDSPDLSPPRRGKVADLSPPRKKVRSRNEVGHDSPYLSPPRHGKDADLSPPRKKVTSKTEVGDDGKSKSKHKMSDGSAGGLRTEKQVVEEIRRKKAMESKVLAELDPSESGRGAETVYRDKRGRRLEGLEELLRQQKGEAKPAEKPLEWGKGLAQKRELEAKFAELEAERSKPFARTRDDPEMDKELRETMRWGDPMAHLVKKKLTEPVLPDLGASEKMKESGFIVPQDIPPHSWIKRGIAPPPNRYGIKPGRHWDGVDRSTGYERDMFKTKNEKQALEREAYLWSVSDM